MIPRKHRELGPFDAVCEKHFKEECIERFYRHVINGEEVLLPRGKPKLLDGALPTEYPDLPSYYTKKLPAKRNPKCREPDTKKIRIDENNDVTLNENLFSDPNLPSEYWAKINFQNQRLIYAFGLWTEVNTNMPAHFSLKPERLIVVKQLEDKTANCCVYINGCQTSKDQIMCTIKDLENLLIDVSKKSLCKGAGFLNEFLDFEVRLQDFHVQENSGKEVLTTMLDDLIESGKLSDVHH